MEAIFKELLNSGKDTYIPDIVEHANAQFSKGNYQQSIAFYELNIITNFIEPGAWNNLGNAYLMSGNMDKAFECYKVVVNLNPRFYDAVVNIGNYFNAKLKDFDEAAKWY